MGSQFESGVASGGSGSSRISSLINCEKRPCPHTVASPPHQLSVAVLTGWDAQVRAREMKVRILPAEQDLSKSL